MPKKNAMLPKRYRGDPFVIELFDTNALSKVKIKDVKNELAATTAGRSKLVRGTLIGAPVAATLGLADGALTEDAIVPASAPAAMLLTLAAVVTNNPIVADAANAANHAAAHELGRRAGKGLSVKLSDT